MALFGYKHRLLQMLIAYEAELTFQAQLVLNSAYFEQYHGPHTM